jgi:negative regulator of flagellin synthesis FlgM
MISKIKDASAQVIQQYQKNEPTKNEADKPIGAAQAVAVTETVDLSTRAKDIQQIRQIIDQTPDIREEKVVELKRQIDSGTYTVNSEKSAEKMVGESLIDLFA